MSRVVPSKISAKGVTQVFGSIVALRKISIELKCGQLTLVEGPNGSGKTTMIQILAGLLKPQAGEILFDDSVVDAMTIRKNVGLVSHENFLYRDLSGKDNVTWVARIQGLDEEAAWANVSSRLGIGAYSKRPVKTYSKGQRQRVALARALIHQPNVLLLDEPTTGLDTEGIKLLCNIIQEELTLQRIIVVVSHDRNLFESFSPQYMSLRDGRLVQ